METYWSTLALHGETEIQTPPVIFRQTLLLSFILLACLALFLSHYGSPIHKWLRISWTFLSGFLAVFLFSVGLVDLLHFKGHGTMLYSVQAIEIAELSIYLVTLAVYGTARCCHSQQLSFLDATLWMGTIVLCLLWFISSATIAMISTEPQLTCYVTMSGTLVVGFLMAVDSWVSSIEGSGGSSLRVPWKEDGEEPGNQEYEPIDASGIIDISTSSGFIPHERNRSDHEMNTQQLV